MEKELLTKLASDLKEQYYSFLYENAVNGYKSIGIELENNRLPEEDVQILDKLFNLDERSLHRGITEFGFDVQKECADLRDLEYEEMRFIMFDKEDRHIGTIFESNHNKTNTGNACRILLGRLMLEYPECRKLIVIHNHPQVVTAVPSGDDPYMTAWLKITLSGICVKLIDDCIISPVDFYARTEDKTDVVLKPISRDTYKKIRDENRYLAFHIMRMD